MTDIRRFDFERDFDKIAAIDAEGVENYWTEDDFKRQLRQKSITCLVAEVGGEVVGFLMYELFLYRYTLGRMSVLPAHRRRGVGSALLGALSDKLTDKRKLISAEVRETNVQFQLFLKSQGYKAVEVIRGYFPDTEEDAFVFYYRSDD